MLSYLSLLQEQAYKRWITVFATQVSFQAIILILCILCYLIMGVINQCRMIGKMKSYSLLQRKTKGQALGQVSFGRNSKRLFEFGHSHYVQYYQKNKFSTMVDALVLMQHVVIQILTEYEHLKILQLHSNWVELELLGQEVFKTTLNLFYQVEMELTRFHPKMERKLGQVGRKNAYHHT